MAITLRNDTKKMELTVVGYEFALEKKMNEFDANWLTVECICTENGETHLYRDSCLLAYELENLLSEFQQILDGKECGMISDFVEPYLKIAVTKVEKLFAVQIRFEYDTDDGGTFYIIQGMNREEYQTLISQMAEMCQKYPSRLSS